MQLSTRAWRVLFLVLLVLAGCKDAPTAPAVAATVAVSLVSNSVIVGQTTQATAVVKGAAGQALRGRTVAWSSSIPVVATVDQSGLVTAVTPGSATITASVDGKAGSSVITVSPVPVATVVVSPSNPSLVVGATQQMSATAKDQAGNPLAERLVAWSSSIPVVATVNQSGLVTAVTPGSATITASVDGKAGSSVITVSPVPVATVVVTPSAPSLAVGSTEQLSATPKDQGGNPLTGRLVAWNSSTPAVATVDQSGLVTGISPGSATITATIDGIAGASEVTAITVLSRVVSGQLYALDGGGFENLEVKVVTLRGTVRAAVDLAGRFSIGIPVGRDSITLIVDAPQLPRTYHPVWIRVVADDLQPALRVIIIPRLWLVASGLYAGTKVSISLEAAFFAPVTEPWAGFWYRTHLPTALPAWPLGAFPVRVAFDRASSTGPISAADSVTFWGVIRTLEADLGMSLFTPANYADLPPVSTPGPLGRGYTVRYVVGLSGGSAGWGAGPDALILGVEISLGMFTDSGAITHEMVHGFGIGHGCSWQGVMNGYCNNFTPRVTAADAAYIRVQYRLEELRRSVAATHGVLEGWQGERVIELGLAPARPPYDH